MKIKIIKKDRVIDKEIVVLTAIAGIALGNLLYNFSTEDKQYVDINGEYWISEESYEEYKQYEKNKNKSSLVYFLSSVEDKKYPVYEFPDGEKYIYGYINQEYYYNGKLIKKNLPVYDFCSNKPLVEPELVRASNGKFYLEEPDYYLDEKGNIYIIDGSAEENVEEKIKIR